MLRQYIFVHFLSTTLLLLLLIAANADAAEHAGSYSVVLASAPGTNLHWQLKDNVEFNGRTVYIEQASVKGSPWERLCLGYFKTRRQATASLTQIRKTYPGAWVQKTSGNVSRLLHQTANTTKPVKKQAVTKSDYSLSGKKLDSLMQRAKTDFSNKRYTSAIRYFNAILSAGTHQYSAEALELLGLSRQRKGQNAHALAAYEKYLELYPEGNAADRVRQRLAGLLTASSSPRKKLQMTTVAPADETTTYGSFSQYYRSNRTQTDDIGSFTSLSQLISFIDLTIIQRSSKFDHRYQFTTDHIYDFIDDRDNSEFRFIETYYELSYRRTGTSGRFGRQSLRIGGILKRFDGISAGYQINPEMRINMLGGFPVDIDNKTSINNNKKFYGFTFETGTFLKNWDMNLFYFKQQYDGLNDRESTGTEVHYRDKTKSLFGMVDYDLFYREVNILQLNANLLLDGGRTLYMNAFMRKSPILATTNALIGRQEHSIDELKKVLNIEQIYQLARDRTANSQTITVGGSQPLTELYQFTADVTFTRIGDTVASGGVPATQGTGTDYFLSTQLVGNNILIKRDTGVLGIRYYNTRPSTTISFIANTRFPITRLWRINPRLQYDIRNFNNGRSQKKLRTILRTNYRYQKAARFDFEVGYDTTSDNNNGQSLGNNNLFFNLGYRWDF